MGREPHASARSTGPEEGPPSAFGPSGMFTMMKRWKVPLESPSESRLAPFRNRIVA